MAANILSWTTRIDNKQLQKDATQTQNIFGRMGKGVASFLSGPAGIATAAIVASTAIKKIVEVNMEFEKSMSSLQSILGVSNEELKFFQQEAVRLGSTTTQTSIQVAEAFKLIGSQKPELLGNREALAAVTEQAIILSEAAGIDVPTAAKALTGSLNQMAVSGDEAARFINILAAGSKVGAADIPYLNQAIEKSGAVARDANLSFEELVGALETIAPSISEPSTAGLQLRDTLLRLQKAGKGFESGQFNMRDALIETKAELDGIQDPVERTKRELELFGKISLVTGKALLNNVDAFDQYTEGVTNTNTALEQQAINTDNLQGSIDMFKSALEGVMLGLNEEGGLTGALKDLVDIGTKVIQNFDVVGGIFEFLLEPIEELFRTLYNLGETLGLVTDEGDAVRGIMQVLATTTKIGLIPLTSLIKIISLLIKGIQFLIQRIKSFVSQNDEMTKGVEFVRQVLDFLKQKFIELITPIKEFVNNVIKVGKSIAQSKLQELIKGISTGISFLINKVRELIANFINFVKSNKIVTGYLDLLKKNFELISKVINRVLKPIKELVGNVNEMAADVSGTDIMGDLTNSMNASSEAIANTNQNLNDLLETGEDVEIITPQTDIQGAQDIGAVISAEEIERLKIEAMQDGLEKRLALIDFETRERIKKYQDAGIYSAEIAESIEQQKQQAIEEVQNDFLAEQAQRILEIETLKLELMQDGINKRLAEIELEYDQRLAKLDEYNLTEQERLDAQASILAQKQQAIDEANRQQQQSILDEERTALEQEIALREAQVNLVDLTEKRKREIELENNILRLQAQRDFDLNMTELQKRTIDAQIEEQRRLLHETRNSNEFLGLSYEELGDTIESFGNKFIQIATDETKTQEEKTKAIKSALLDEVQAVITSSVIKFTASVLAQTQPAALGLILAPLAAIAARGLFAGLRTQLNFAQGGIVPGTSLYGDKVAANVNSREMILNLGQQKQLFAIANGGGTGYNKQLVQTNALLQEQNHLLKSQKQAILHNNTILEMQNGKMTGGKTYL